MSSLVNQTCTFLKSVASISSFSARCFFLLFTMFFFKPVVVAIAALASFVLAGVGINEPIKGSDFKVGDRFTMQVVHEVSIPGPHAKASDLPFWTAHRGAPQLLRTSPS